MRHALPLCGAFAFSLIPLCARMPRMLQRYGCLLPRHRAGRVAFLEVAHDVSHNIAPRGPQHRRHLRARQHHCHLLPRQTM